MARLAGTLPSASLMTGAVLDMNQVSQGQLVRVSLERSNRTISYSILICLEENGSNGGVKEASF